MTSKQLGYSANDSRCIDTISQLDSTSGIGTSISMGPCGRLTFDS
jgi:hypothetical protein